MTGIATLPALLDDKRWTTEVYLERSRAEVTTHLRAGKFVLCLGGEHTLSQAPATAALEIHGEIGVVQFDAHADLRATYEGSPQSHACVMRRIHEAGIPSLGIGIRFLSPAEARFVAENELSLIWGQELGELAPIAGQTSSEFTIARLAFKCLAYRQAARWIDHPPDCTTMAIP